MANDRDDDLEREIEAHLQLEAEERMADGTPEQDAREAARRAFGSIARTREDVRDIWTRVWLRDVARDAGYACRTLARHRGFAAVSILTLALGMGAAMAIFALVNAVMLRPLPFRDPDRLVVLWDDFSALNGPANVEPSPANFRDWRDQNRVFGDVAAIEGRTALNLTGAGDPETVAAAKVTGNLFHLLGLSPIKGRTLGPDDDRPGAGHVAVISEGFWRRRFGSDPAVVGHTIALDAVPHTVVGIVPGDFQFPAAGIEVWVPSAFTPQQLASQTTFYLYVVARLKPGVSLAQARAEMNALAPHLWSENPALQRVGITVVPLHEQYVRNSRTLYVMLVAAVGILLLIACANVAHLLLARGAERRREIALRGALGAGRGRILRQLLTESLVLASAGGVAGAGLAWLASGFIGRMIPENFPEGMALGSSSAMLLCIAAVATFTSVAFGVGPALTASRFSVHDALQGWSSRGVGRRERAVRSALVVAEVSMSVVLLIAAGLLLRSFVAVSAVDIGFPSRGLLVAVTQLAPAVYASAPRRMEFVDDVLDRVRSTPGVVSAGYVNFLPLTFPGGRASFHIDGRPDPPPEQMSSQMAVNRAVSTDYLRTLGVPLRFGRHFDELDRPGAAPAVIINETMARRFWPDEDPTGRRIRFGIAGANGPWLTIVGVVGDVHQIRLDLGAEPELYVPFTQVADDAPPFSWPRYLVVRTSGDPETMAPAVRAAVARVDGDQPVARMQSMDAVIDGHLADRGRQLSLMTAFAVLALVLASIGLYGVLAHAVARQTPEIGLRIALGATRAGVVGPLLRRTLVLTACGITLGVAASAAVTRILTSLLFEVSPIDPYAFAGVPILLVAVAMLACWAPARRATKVDPLVALRAD